MKIIEDKGYLVRYKKFLEDNFQVSSDEWDVISRYGEIIFVPKNEYFVEQGKICRWLGFIAAGIMRFCMFRDDKDITCYFVNENDFAGDPESFYARKPSDKNMQALTDCVLAAVTLENLQHVHQQLPRFGEIMREIDHRVMMGLMTQRDFLQHADAAEKYRLFMKHYPHILQNVPLSYIASFLGITQQSLSRLRKEIS